MHTTEQLNTALAGRYTVERLVGEGGMAGVYLAYDLRHERKVALKVLKPELAAVLGADRFVQEIKTTANLQHPHILPLFDSGTADGILFYVMPYIEGESLRDRLNRETQLGVDAAVQIARDVADALEHAHRHGVIHRDIKPENILLQDGRPVVADFGIALAVSAAAGGRMTETGLSLGTPHYMSPEQATAEKDLTPRSDVYSLGSVLYEMLTGEPPHMGKSAQQIIMKIVTDRARPVAELRKSVPMHVAAAVDRSLEKLAADRFESARAFGDALADPGFRASTTRVAPIGAAREQPVARVLATKLAVAAVLLATGAVAALAAARYLSPRAAEMAALPVRFALDMPESHRINVPVLAVSPNGRFVAYRAAYPAGIGLFIRDLTRLRTEFVDGSRPSPTSMAVTFSPDSKWLAFTMGANLLRASVDGGAATIFVRNLGLDQPVWLDGDMLVGSDSGGSIVALDPTLGARRVVVPADSGRRYRNVRPVSTGALALSIAGPGVFPDTLAIVGLDGRNLTSLALPARRALGVVDGVLFFVGTDNALQAVPLDLGKRVVSGTPRLLVPGVNEATYGAAMSPTGTAVFVGEQRDWNLVSVDQRGTETMLGEETRNFVAPRLSPDGKQIAVHISDGVSRSDVWVRDAASGSMTRLTSRGSANVNAEWAPDSRSLFFVSSEKADSSEVWRQPVDNTGPPEQLTSSGGRVREVAVSPDGRHLVVRLQGDQSDLFTRSIGSERDLAPFVAGPGAQITPRFSPNGKWVAYASNESGDFEVYVQPFPGPGPRRLVSAGGGRVPVWSADGRTLFYWRSSQVFAADVRPGAAFESGTPRFLFTTDYRPGTLVHAGYDVTPGGSFIFVKPARAVTIEVALNLPALYRDAK